MKFKKNGEWKDIGFKVADTLPVGSVVDFNGSEVPSGWEEVPDEIKQRLDNSGIGTCCKDISNQDLNTACGVRNGFYMGNALINAPASGWLYVVHLLHNDKYAKQLAFNFFASQIWQRTQQNGSWSAWEQVNKEPTGDVLWINPNAKDALVSSYINANFSDYSKFRVFIYVDTNCSTLIQWDINSDYIGQDVTLTYASHYSRVIQISSNQLRVHSGYYDGSQNNGALILSHIIGYK